MHVLGAVFLVIEIESGMGMGMDRILSQLSSSLNTAQTIDQLVRPMLEMLAMITNMESTYLTDVDLDGHSQRIRFARNSGELDIAEGLTVQWEDTLCKRALDSGQLACSSVPQRWGDSTAAASLHIQSYVSAPVSNADGQLLGTLCAASTRTVQITEQVEALFRLFANIVGNFIEREVLMEKLQAANDQLATHALTDLLTGLPNRRAMVAELERLLAQAERSGVSTLVGVIDLDGFKQINDRYGHQGGDEFLQAIARRVQGGLRGSDLIGRLGGDEFLFIGPGPQQGDPQHAALRTQQRLEQLIAGHYQLGEHQLDYAGASVGVVALPPQRWTVEAAIEQADTLMYRHKNARRQAAD